MLLHDHVDGAEAAQRIPLARIAVLEHDEIGDQYDMALVVGELHDLDLEQGVREQRIVKVQQGQDHLRVGIAITYPPLHEHAAVGVVQLREIQPILEAARHKREYVRKVQEIGVALLAHHPIILLIRREIHAHADALEHRVLVVVLDKLLDGDRIVAKRDRNSLHFLFCFLC